MPLTLYNSLTRRKEIFEPLDPACVRMYVCGPTVYDRAHIGNARAVVAFDQLYRVLRHIYGADHVRYVRNITDVDDKIIAASRETGEPIAALTRRTTAEFHADMAALNTLPPDVEPRATAHIAQMIAMIERLLASGHAYAAEGHVLFSVASDPQYGILSRRSRAEMIAGARVEVAPYKHDPGDFVLWKPSEPDQPGWESPWGRGRPGWHIECSAMSEAHLGESFDIHGGGLDLIFPHHENEIAQSTSAHPGKPFARYWLHNGFLTVSGAKMAKSLGNFVTAHDLLEEWPGEAIRLALLSTHYRDPLDWTEGKLRQAKQTLDRWYRALMTNGNKADEAVPPPQNVLTALDDDLNTPLAITELHSLANTVFHEGRGRDRLKAQTALLGGARLMGLLDRPPAAWFQRPVKASLNATLAPATLSATAIVGRPARVSEQVNESAVAQDRSDAEVTNPRVDALVVERMAARKDGRFAEADRIRAELAEEGIILEDHPDGTTTWRRA